VVAFSWGVAQLWDVMVAASMKYQHFMNTKYIGVGVSLGLCFGAALGAVMHNVGLGIAIGLPLGTAIGVALASANRKV
jgi:hypothetical protein